MEMVTPPSGSAERGPTLPPSVGTSFGTQANALLRKNLTYQKRNYKTNCCLIIFPAFLIVSLVLLQKGINSVFSGEDFKCGCISVPNNVTGSPEKKCGVEYSSASQANFCPIKNPITWPALLQIPAPQYRATQTDKFSDFPNESCLQDNSCPVSLLYTGQNQSLSEDLMRSIFSPCSSSIGTGSTILDALSTSVLGTDSWTFFSNYLEPAFLPDSNPLLVLKTDCINPALTITNSTQLNLNSVEGNFSLRVGVGTVESFWRGNGTAINNVLYEGFLKGNPDRKIKEISAAYDFGSTSQRMLDATIWYNSTFRNDTAQGPPGLARVSRSMNMVAKAFLRLLNGPNSELPLTFIKEMPKPESSLRLDFSSLLSPVFYMLVIQLLFPVILQQLVYEKENNLRIMMKMHGLGDGPYLLISYLYFLFISVVYLLCFVAVGSASGLNFFRLTDYSLQLVFYFVYANLQVALAFLASTVFSSVKTSSGCSIPYIIGFSLLGLFLFQNFLEDPSFSRSAIFAMELLPGFSLYRGLYEFSAYAFVGSYQGTKGMGWSDALDSQSGFRDIMGIMIVEWFIFLLLAYYLDQVIESGGGVKKSPLFFLDAILRKKKRTLQQPSQQMKSEQLNIQMQRADVEEERIRVEEAINGTSGPHTIICNDLRKVYPGRDGNPEKFAVRGLSLAIPKGECFGMLGPNGAGKTSSINMMIGLSKPTSGSAFIDGLDICKDMDTIYTYMGVCPQHDLIWATLTGREHLLFYGRLKNLKGSELLNAVESSLKSVNLFNGGVGDRLAGKYSGGMKRRLSVAISLIGNPKVVYMDEPSTGLDPASRSNLWNVVKNAKRDRAIILTTHSMEEAETLCDRLGIFVDGQLQCIGTAGEFKSRYGGTYSLTISTPESEVEAVLKMVLELSPNAKQVYALSGTQKFELPKTEVRITDVFKVVENAKSLLSIQAWGVADTTLEDVFIKIARETGASNKLS